MNESRVLKIIIKSGCPLLGINRQDHFSNWFAFVYPRKNHAFPVLTASIIRHLTKQDFYSNKFHRSSTVWSLVFLTVPPIFQCVTNKKNSILLPWSPRVIRTELLIASSIVGKVWLWPEFPCWVNAQLPAGYIFEPNALVKVPKQTSSAETSETLNQDLSTLLCLFWWTTSSAVVTPMHAAVRGRNWLEDGLS